MPLPWHRLHRQLLDSTHRRSFETDFAALRRSDGCLAGVADLPQLLGLLRGKSLPQDRKNTILTALVEAARGPDVDAADAALTALLLVLWPGLDAAHGRLRRHFPDDPDDLPGEILDRAITIIRTMDLARVTAVAAAVVLGARRDVMRARLAMARPTEPPEVPDAIDAEDRLLAREIVELLGADADLVLVVAVDGQSQVAAGAGIGLAPETAWKRYRRAIRRVRQWL